MERALGLTFKSEAFGGVLLQSEDLIYDFDFRKMTIPEEAMEEHAPNQGDKVGS